MIRYLIVFGLIQCSLIAQDRINGLTIVGSPSEYEKDPFPRVNETHANWICLDPYGFSRVNSTKVYNNVDRQWWGEKVGGVEESIKLAKQSGFKIMLKPQVYVPGAWPGEIDFKKKKDWETWEAEYKSYIFKYLDLAIKYDVEIFCIGTEFKIGEKKREHYWRTLIDEIRCLYPGKLTYSSNWDSYEDMPFWDALDYIGVSSYFPLSENDTPTSEELMKAWQPVKAKLKKYSEKVGKKVLFTEYGYLSVDGCAGKTWILEKKVDHLDINEDAQASSLRGLYSSLWEEDFWAGGFLWKWFPNDQGHEGYIDKDYTPKNKKAEAVLKEWFSKTP